MNRARRVWRLGGNDWCTQIISRNCSLKCSQWRMVQFVCALRVRMSLYDAGRQRATFKEHLITVQVWCLKICCIVLLLPFPRLKYPSFPKDATTSDIEGTSQCTTALHTYTHTHTHTHTQHLRCCLNKHMTRTTNHTVLLFLCLVCFTPVCLLQSIALLDKKNK